MAVPSTKVMVPILMVEDEPVSIPEAAGTVNKVLGTVAVRSIRAADGLVAAETVKPLAERANTVAVDAVSSNGVEGTAEPTGAATVPVKMVAVAVTVAPTTDNPDAFNVAAVIVAKVPPIPIALSVFARTIRITFALLAVADVLVPEPAAAVVEPAMVEPRLVVIFAAPPTVAAIDNEDTLPVVAALAAPTPGATPAIPPANSIKMVTVEPEGMATPVTILRSGAITAAPAVVPKNCSLAYVTAEVATEVTADAEPIITNMADATAVCKTKLRFFILNSVK